MYDPVLDRSTTAGRAMTEQRARAQRHLVPHFTPGAAWRSDSLPIFERADGCYLYDTEGNEWLDGLAGLFCVNIGHGRTDLAEVAADQMGPISFSSRS